ncbi:hypothetical protein MTO96_020751 [Rhipicephalus appendiculatus]
MPRQDKAALHAGQDPAPAGAAGAAGVQVAGSPAGADSLSESMLLEHSDRNSSFPPWLMCICVGLFIGIALFILFFMYKATVHEENVASYGKDEQTTSTFQSSWQYQSDMRPRRANASRVITTASAGHDALSKAPTASATTSDSERRDGEATATTETDEDRSTGVAFEPGFIRRGLFEPASPVRNLSSPWLTRAPLFLPRYNRVYSLSVPRLRYNIVLKDA